MRKMRRGVGGVRSVATGGWSVHSVESDLCSVWCQVVVLGMSNVMDVEFAV